tara:strand:- start:4936 stop:5697 length:762 start_codon:yes stop_codon:yes gene_type:complete
MIAKIITGTNAKGLLQYLTSKQNEVITSNNIFPDLTIKEISKEIEIIQGLNRRCKKNLMHVVLSFPNHDNLDSLKMKSITEDFIEAFKAEDCMSISYRHFDRSHPHVHCVINKIKMDGSVLSDSFSHIRAKKICRKIEQIYDLTRVSNISQENKNSSIEKLQKEIDIAINGSDSFEAFVRKLQLKKYKVLKGRGIAFIDSRNGTKVKGSAIGRNYSLSNINKRLLENNELKDIHKIIKIIPNQEKNRDHSIGF